MPEPTNGPDRRSSASSMRSLGVLSGVGFAFVLAVVIGFAIGYALDGITGLSPLFTILFFFLGVIAGIVNVVRASASFSREQERSRPTKEAGLGNQDPGRRG
jgi:ATP synthase protein I